MKIPFSLTRFTQSAQKLECAEQYPFQQRPPRSSVRGEESIDLLYSLRSLLLRVRREKYRPADH